MSLLCEECQCADLVNTPEGDLVCTSCGLVQVGHCTESYLTTQFGEPAHGEHGPPPPPSVADRLFPHVHGLSLVVDRGENTGSESNVHRLAQSLRRTHLYSIDRVDLDRAVVTRQVTDTCQDLVDNDAVMYDAMKTFWDDVDHMSVKGENRRALVVSCIDEAYHKHTGQRLDWMHLCETIGVSSHLAHRMERARRDAGRLTPSQAFETDIWTPLFHEWCISTMQGNMHRAPAVKERMSQILETVRHYPQLTRLKPSVLVQAMGHVAYAQVHGTTMHGPPPPWSVLDVSRKIKRVLVSS